MVSLPKVILLLRFFAFVSRVLSSSLGAFILKCELLYPCGHAYEFPKDGMDWRLSETKGLVAKMTRVLSLGATW